MQFAHGCNKAGNVKMSPDVIKHELQNKEVL